MSGLKVAEQLSEIVLNRLRADRLVLPTMPVAADQCLKLLRSPDANLKQVARVLERDPLLTARVLRQASSAALGGGATANVDQAVARLGVQKLKTLVVDASAKRVFESRDPRITKVFGQLWEHSVAVGLLARDVAALTQAGDGDTAYLAGLLHDIGKPVVGTLMLEAEKLLASSRAAWIGADEWLAGVQKVHREIGRTIAERWQLPEVVRKTIDGASEYDSGERHSAGNAVCFANALAKAHGFYAGECDVEDAKALVMIGRSLLGIDDELIARLVATLRERIASET